MSRATKRLSYANVMATVAVFVALGGGAYAAFHLARNSVASRNIQNGQVKSADVRDEGIAGRDIAEDTLTHNDIAETSLSATPSQPMLFKGEPGDGPSVVLDLPALVVNVDCTAGGMNVIATTDSNGAVINSAFSTAGDASAHEMRDADFGVGDNFDVTGTSDDDTAGVLVYTRANGASVTANFQADRNTALGTCLFAGTANYSSQH
jgi:hypothetical protein